VTPGALFHCFHFGGRTRVVRQARRATARPGGSPSDATRDTPAARAIHFAVLRTLATASYSPALILQEGGRTPMYETLALLAAFTAAYSAVAGRVQRTWISGPIVFTAFGLLLGPFGLGLLRIEAGTGALRALAELTLALVLFTDAAGADLGVLRRAKALPIRLLAIGLPLTILLGFGAGTLLLGDLSGLEVALLATMLAPTDAALGRGVVTNEAVPVSARQGLSVESGLNDGICVPILFLFLALAQGEGEGRPLRQGLALFMEEVGIGLAVGLVLAGAAVLLLRLCQRLGWLASTWINVTVVAVAFACFGSAQALGGSGFIASFAGGMLFGGLLRPYRQRLLGAAEGIGDTFALVTWVLFGSAVVGRAFGHCSGPVVLYAVLSLTVVRMLPVLLALWGLGGSTESKLFAGWFGPRGLASIVFGVIVADAALPHGDVLDRYTGEIVWEWKAPKGGSFVSVLLDGDRLIAATSGYVYCLDPVYGQLVWENPLKGKGQGPCSLASVSGAALSAQAAAVIAQPQAAASAAAGSAAAGGAV
jgi:NhaP-type Na+/H+ or K+/H+ antiporter